MQLKWDKEVDNQQFASNAHYKIRKFPLMQNNKWCAYFKPGGWVNFGNACEKTTTERSKTYRTKTEAKKACQRHYDAFGDLAEANKKLSINK